LILNYKFT